MKKFLVLIDGPKGAGKSTISELLKGKLSNTEFFSIDEERKIIKKSGDRDEDNTRAFISITQKLVKVFEEQKNAVLDSAVFDNRLSILEDISKKYGVHLYKFSITAPPEVLRSRVKEREESKGKIFNCDRFDYTLGVVQNKSFEDFYVLDSDKLSAKEIFKIIYSKIT